MKKIFTLLFALLLTIGSLRAAKPESDYMVLASNIVNEDSRWREVVDILVEKHNAEVVVFNESPSEAIKSIRRAKPRYVAIVDVPENIGRDYVIDFHHTSRDIDNDIYADFMWGIITGYDAEAAMRMVNNSTEPLVIKDAVATIMELNSAKWFDNYAWVDDHTKGLWGEKRGRNGDITTGMVAPEQVLTKFTELYATFNPDLIVTAAHATQKNLEMPYSLGNIKARDGRLYAEDRFTGDTWDLQESGKRRVYAAVGNCLIGDMNNTKESMAAAWMNGSNVTTMIGYVVTTWHGRNGWGALKYWASNPERYTLAEAVYINQQDFLHQQHEWYPSLIDERYDYRDKFMEELTTAAERISEAVGRDIDMEDAKDWDMMGFWHDRDVLVYYGDPKWDVRLQSAGEQDYTVTSERRGKRYIITITTGADFSMEKMRGDNFKQEHVLDLPFSHIFPEPLKRPRLVDADMWGESVVADDFLLLYDVEFVPSQQYEIVLKIK